MQRQSRMRSRIDRSIRYERPPISLSLSLPLSTVQRPSEERIESMHFVGVVFPFLSLSLSTRFKRIHNKQSTRGMGTQS